MHDAHDNTPKVYGLMAEFDDPGALLKAAKTAYAEGYRDLDAYSPFPVHGLSEAIGFHKTRVSWFTLVAGLTGAATGFALQYIGNAWHYPYDIGGKPYFSWPAYIPITFECTILFAAFTTGIAMLVMNGLPMPYHPVFNAKHFDRATSDRFFLCIEAKDRKYDARATREFLQRLQPGPIEVSEVME
jgi:hypothetical protein